MISSSNLAELPPIDALKKLCQSVALLDAILEQQWDLRYFSFDAKWSEKEMMGSMRDGSGNGYFILFNPVGAIIIGNSPHSPMGRRLERSGNPLPGEFEQVPPELSYALNEPAFSAHPAAFCLWQTYTEAVWRTSQTFELPEKDPDGSADLLFILNADPETYKKWSEDYFEISVPLEAIQEIYAHNPLTYRLLKKIKAERTRAELNKDIAEIGYPSRSPSSEGKCIEPLSPRLF